MPHLSIIIDATGSPAPLAASVAGVRSQHFDDWELLVPRSFLSAQEIGELSRDARIRPMTVPDSPTGALNTLVRAATGEYIIWLPAGTVWEQGQLSSLLAALAATPGQPVLSARESNPVTLLGNLCVEDVGIPGTLAHPRLALLETGLLDERLVVSATWELALRLLRVREPTVLAPAPESLERELTLDVLGDVLADVLYIHAGSRDLAEQIPGVAARQSELRSHLFAHLDAGLPTLSKVMGAQAVADQLCRITEATLAVGHEVDRQALRALLRTAERSGVGNFVLHRLRLKLLRVMAQPEAIVLTCQSSPYPMDNGQLAELVHAMRQLGANDDATRIAETVPDATLVLEPLPATRPLIPDLDETDGTAATFAPWVVRIDADADMWAEAADAYACAGLSRAATAAASRAGRSAPVMRTDDSAEAAAVDLRVAEALAMSPVPLIPVTPKTDTLVLLESTAQLLRPGAFGAALLDAQTASLFDRPLAYVLQSVTPNTMIIDLDPGLGVRPARVLQQFPNRTYALLADHTLHLAQLSRGLAFAENRLQLSTDVDVLLLHAPAHDDILLHATLSARGLQRALSVIDRISRPWTVAWSGTDVPCLWEEPVAQQCIAVMAERGGATNALVWEESSVAELSLADAPRGHVLISRSYRAVAQ